MLSTYVASTRDHNETLVGCFAAFFLYIPFRGGSGEVHSRVGTVGVDVVVARVFAHLDQGFWVERTGVRRNT